ncbi:MAG: amidohydrolase family protein [Alphaproteobacteria bacterium]|nr:amidohydrolase family protein [Alphaproteobacteria bacterium]
MSVLFISLSLAACATEPQSDSADIVIWGGRIHTGLDQPSPEAIAIDQGRIVFVGARAAAQRRVGADTRVIDLRGAALYPGFVDAHAHLLGIGQRELTLNLEGVASLAAMLARVRERVAVTPPGEIIWGRGWIETHWPEARFPTRADLDSVAPDHPVLLVRADGHALVANSAALQRAGVSAATAPPDGGEILRDAARAPTGMLIDAAMDLVAELAPRETPEEIERALRVGLEVYRARGWTAIHNMSVSWAEVEALERLDTEGALPLRVYNAVTPENLDLLLTGGVRKSASGRLETRAVKFYMDGALGSRGAALFEPYADAPETRGLEQMNRDAVLPLWEQALRNGVQIATHAIGDRGNAMALDWYAATFDAVPRSERAVAEPRWRIEHAQIVRPVDLPRFAELGVIASMQPSHAISDLHFAPSRLGDARLDGAYAWRRMIEEGAALAAGSDAPVEKGDPLIEFYAATARRDLNGFQGSNWRAADAVDRTQALRMLTYWPAYAAFAETERGVIAEGMRADLSIFSVDLMSAPLADIPRGRALATIVDGEIIYRAADW